MDPNYKFSKSNRNFLKNLGIKKIYNYLAPEYQIKNLSDKILLGKINKIEPDFILTNIGGGKQEILGLYLKKILKLNQLYYVPVQRFHFSQKIKLLLII